VVKKGAYWSLKHPEGASIFLPAKFSRK